MPSLERKREGQGGWPVVKEEFCYFAIKEPGCSSILAALPWGVLSLCSLGFQGPLLTMAALAFPLGLDLSLECREDTFGEGQDTFPGLKKA